MQNIKLARTISDSASSTATLDQLTPASTLVVFDSRVQDLDLLYQALLPGSIGFTIRPQADGVETITDLLAATGAKYLAIVAHGEPGAVHLGKTPLNIQQLQARAGLLQSWDVDEIALYSCEVAQGVGRDFVYQLSELTGARVAAAATKTGNRELGGSWDLTVTTGAIVAPILFDSSILEGYPAVLAVSFGAAKYSPVGDAPRSITVGDFNGDGNLDLATANNVSNNVSVLLGNGTGGFGAATNFGAGTRPYSVTTGDFNGDGNLDLATADFNSNNVSVLLGNGTGGFGAATDFAVGAAGAGPASVTVGDFNGDGNLDLATANNGSNNVSVLLGNGRGGFGAATNFGVGDTPDSVTAGDFNGDGKLDLAVANNSTDNISVRLNTTVPTLARNDYNGDGKSDILWRNDDGRVVLWQMDGKTVTNSSLVATAVPTAWQVVGTGDFNGDRKAETLWRNTTDGSISIGAYSPPTAPPIVGAVPTALQVVGTGDFNGDGKSDILWRNTTNNDVSIWQMNGTASINQTVVGNASSTWKVAGTGDFTGDGKTDVLWRNDDGSIALWQVDGTKVTSTLTSIPSVDSTWKINGTADFNGDGKADILWRNDDGSVAIWQMDGKNVVSRLKTSEPLVDTTWKITGTADFNGDGKADILWRNDSGAVAIWEMNGATISSASLTSTPLVDNSWKIAAPIL